MLGHRLVDPDDRSAVRTVVGLAEVKSILDRSFRYVPAAQTDIRRTFERIKREQRANAAEAKTKVKPIKERKQA